MRLRNLFGVIIFLTLLLAGCSGSADPSIPQITKSDRGWVDTTGTVPGETLEALRAQSDRIGTLGFQLAGVFFKDINSDPAQFATKVANENGIGSAEKDNGLTIMVLLDRPGSKNDPKPYIFVATGKGMEGLLPDSKFTLFRENFFNPLRKDGKWQDGLVQLATKFADFLTQPEADEFRDLKSPDSGWPWWVWVLIFLGLVVLAGALRGATGYGGSYYSGSSSSSSSGGGSFGGGGSSGGGGSGG